MATVKKTVRYTEGFSLIANSCKNLLSFTGFPTLDKDVLKYRPPFDTCGNHLTFMQLAPLKNLSSLQRILVLICLIVALRFLLPLLVAVAGMVVCYYGYRLYTSNDSFTRLQGVLVIVGGVLIAWLSGLSNLIVPLLGFALLEATLRIVGYPSLLPFVRDFFESLTDKF